MIETARIAPPPAIVTDPVERAAQLDKLNADFPEAHAWASDAGLIYAVVPADRARPWAGNRTLDADNPAEMRALLDARRAA